MKKNFLLVIKKRSVMLLHFIIYLFAKIYVLATHECTKNVWLMAERGYDARDNAYVLYKYIKRNYPDITCKYVIANDSFDVKRIDKKDIVWHGSWENYILFLTAKIMISTHTYGYSPDMQLFSKIDKYNLVKVNGKKVYLTHFLLDRTIFSWNTKEYSIDLYTCSSKCDYDNALSNSDYGETVIQLTGTPRMDNLFRHRNYQTDNVILIMPTWRYQFVYMTKQEFENSEYFKNYNNLISNPYIVDYLEKNNCKLIFYPHIEVQKFINCFKSMSDRIIIGDAYKYVVEDLLLKTRLLITDYSSVHADFALLGKKVIYFQFDAKEEQKARPWASDFFSFENDGFGPIFYDLDTLIRYIISQSSFNMDKIYFERIGKIFPVFDDNNCNRVFDAINNLIDK